ncbi:hypothetical protein FOXG_17254 [Fusarium oxysporum f. sp. lycopersici 4287]|uniref:Kinesin light chain n=1 Tax=Fusarium oxysporum f. sp. lycopersici (strain 4287 / CBS 123668 / FGSC 9935 / NRRL 34936) TaxID=426428 RepID=A0A0J9W9I4_FUSO4|nr:hypothetical protein FOXG_17254 [Fusarium oxysporum f. sp. lycopersici 4287]KNB19999.1 hypothetical protein FOXG_17254 [Fusarium oxysporum f. sp. lycopersici 4287]
MRRGILTRLFYGGIWRGSVPRAVDPKKQAESCSSPLKSWNRCWERTTSIPCAHGKTWPCTFVNKDVNKRQRFFTANYGGHTISFLATNTKTHWTAWKASQLEVLKTRRSAPEEDPARTLISTANLAYIYLIQGRYQEAKVLRDRVIEQLKNIVDEGEIDALTALEKLALTYERTGSFREALRIRENVIEQKCKLFGEGDIRTLESKSRLASACALHDGYKEAKPMLEDVLKRMAKVVSADHPALISHSHHMAIMLRKEKHFKEAEEMMKSVLKSKREVLGPEHPETILEMFNLAWFYIEQLKPKEALSLTQSAPELKAGQLGKGSPLTIGNQINLAFFISFRGLLSNPIDLQRMEKGLEMLRQIMEGMERSTDETQERRRACEDYIRVLGRLSTARMVGKVDGTTSGQPVGTGIAESEDSSAPVHPAKRRSSTPETSESTPKKFRISDDEIECPDENQGAKLR